MKTSWFIGLISLWFVMMILSGIAEQSNLVTSTVVESVQGLVQPEGTDVGSISTGAGTSAAYSIVTSVFSYLGPFFQMVFLWHPTLWTGSWFYFYLVFCLPIAVAMVISIVFVFRGVNSG